MLRTAGGLPVLALLFNALVWGLSWWPFRQLQARGLHSLWATALIYILCAVVIAAWRPRALRQLLREPGLWVILVAAGTTNASFNWGVSIGDVVRVVLLFYLMPLWTLLLSRLLLREPPTPLAIARVAAALAGAALVLLSGPGEAGVAGGLAGVPAGGASQALADALALLGGFTFALNNVMLRRQADMPGEGRALAMFVGGAVVAAGTAAALSAGWAGAGAGAVPWPAHPGAWWLPAAGLALAFLASNLCLQYGATRLPASATAVVMPAEVLFAALSAVAWGGAVLRPGVLAGGALILGATVAALGPRGAGDAAAPGSH